MYNLLVHYKGDLFEVNRSMAIDICSGQIWESSVFIDRDLKLVPNSGVVYGRYFIDLRGDVFKGGIVAKEGKDYVKENNVIKIDENFQVEVVQYEEKNRINRRRGA